MKQSPLQRFWKLLSPYQKAINQIYLYAILNGMVNLSLPLGIQAIILFIQGGEISTSWMLLVLFVLMGIAAAGVFQIQQLRIVEDIQQDIFARSSMEFSYRMPNIKLLALDKIHAPELVNRFFDTLTIQKGLPKILIDFSLAAFQIIFGMVLLTIYSPYFSMLGLFFVLLMWIVFRFTGPKGLDTSMKESKQKYRIAHWLEEIARSNKSFKMNMAKGLHLDKTDDISVDYIQARRNHFRVLIQQFIHFIGFKITVAAGLLILGSFLVIKEQMNIGQFVASEIIIILIIASVEKIIRVMETIYDVLTALEKIGFVSDLELEDTGKTLRVDTDGALEIEVMKLSFTYPESTLPTVDKLYFKVPKKARATIVGESGSGKSTLLHLMAGFYSASTGQIMINKIPVGNYNKKDLYSNIGINFAGDRLFEATIRENICMGRNVNDKAIFEIIEKLGLTEFLAQTSHGIHTKLDPEGRRLPKSVNQKLLTARAIVCKPKLLLLEDPLTFVDETEKRSIIDYIMAPEHDWTVVVIADFPYWQQKCTQLISLDPIAEE